MVKESLAEGVGPGLQSAPMDWSPLTSDHFPREVRGDQAAIEAAYGDPESYLHADADRPDFDVRWRGAILQRVAFPSPVSYSGTAKTMSGIYVHRRIAAALDGVLSELADSGAWRHVLDCAGAYCYRLQRGGISRSLHCWGAAIDFNALRYPLGTLPDFEDPFVRIVVPTFERHGWLWGGRWTRPDVQHLQATLRFSPSTQPIRRDP